MATNVPAATVQASMIDQGAAEVYQNVCKLLSYLQRQSIHVQQPSNKATGRAQAVPPKSPFGSVPPAIKSWN